MAIGSIFLLAASSAANAVVEVRMRERAVASGSVVRLGDVAEVVAADRELARRVAAMQLMPAPAPGTQRFVERREIEDLIVAQGVDHRELQFVGAPKVAVATPGQSTAKSAVTNEITGGGQMNRHAAILAGRTSEQPVATVPAARAEELRHEVERAIVGLLSEQAGPVGKWQATCEIADRHLPLLNAATSPLACQGGAAPWVGRQRFSVSFHTPQGSIQVPVYAEIGMVSAPVVVAAGPIARGTIITAADVQLQTIDFLPKVSDRRRVLETVEPLIGMEARQAIQAGDVVYSDQVQSPIVVKRGETVRVISQAGGIRVRTTARAQQDGARGELVQLESLDKREKFDARVTGPGEVAVFALARPTAAEPPAWIETARRTK